MHAFIVLEWKTNCKFYMSCNHTCHWTSTALFCSITDAVDQPNLTNWGKPNTLSILSDKNLFVLGSNKKKNIFWSLKFLLIENIIPHYQYFFIYKQWIYIVVFNSLKSEGCLFNLTSRVSTSISILMHSYLLLKLPFWQSPVPTNLWNRQLIYPVLWNRQ